MAFRASTSKNTQRFAFLSLLRPAMAGGGPPAKTKCSRGSVSAPLVISPSCQLEERDFSQGEPTCLCDPGVAASVALAFK